MPGSPSHCCRLWQFQAVCALLGITPDKCERLCTRFGKFAKLDAKELDRRMLHVEKLLLCDHAVTTGAVVVPDESCQNHHKKNDHPEQPNKLTRLGHNTRCVDRWAAAAQLVVMK